MTNELRPRELALLMLAASGAPPRQRARDQKADRAGESLRRRVLERLLELDPDFAHLDAALLRIIGELSPPTGPVRALATVLRDDLLAARANPALTEHLLTTAMQVDRHRGGPS